MKKSNKIMLAIYIVIGIALVIIGVTIQVDYYSSMIFAMGFALIFSSILQLVRYYHNTRPEEIHKHREPSQISYHQSRDSAREHHDAPLWISRTKELRTLK